MFRYDLGPRAWCRPGTIHPSSSCLETPKQALRGTEHDRLTWVHWGTAPFTKNESVNWTEDGPQKLAESLRQARRPPVSTHIGSISPSAPHLSVIFSHQSHRSLPCQVDRSCRAVAPSLAEQSTLSLITLVVDVLRFHAEASSYDCIACTKVS